MSYILAETLGNISKWYDSINDLIDENVRNIFEYDNGSIIIKRNLTIGDLTKLLNPQNKTYGTIFVRYYDGSVESQNIPPITEYAIPFNDDALDILSKYEIVPPDRSWREPRITVLDLDSTYNGLQKVESFDIWDYRSTLITIRLALFSLNNEQICYLLSRIKEISNIELTVVGNIDDEMSRTIKFVVDRSSNFENCLTDILSGRLGVLKLENHW